MGPKKLIIPDKNEKITNKVTNTKEEEKSSVKKSEVLESNTNKKQTKDVEIKDSSKNDPTKKENIQIKPEKESEQEENAQDSKKQKRQSFISDFAALEKTYKILGLSKEAPKSEEINVPVKKRHNSEGKVKNKDKAKANRKSAVLSDAEPLEVKESTPKIEVKIDALDKGKAIAKRSFFQDLINEKKGLVKKEPELLRPQIRKKSKLVSAFEQNPPEEKDVKRKSITYDDVRVDTQKFNAFLNKFESKDQRAEAKAQMIKITREQKEFDRQKQIKEEQRRLAKLQEQEKRHKEEEEKERRAEIEEERRIEEERQTLRIKEDEELRRLELERIENENTEMKIMNEKKKVAKKKKKTKKEEEIAVPEEALKLGLSDYNNVKSKFEKKKIEEAAEVTSPIKPLRINKLMNNPFLEAVKPEEKPQNREVKVNKLMKNSFIEQLEKRGSLVEDYEKPKQKPVIKKEETKQKKLSSDTNIKFESKKEKKISQETGIVDDTKNERRLEVRVSKSIEGQNPKKKVSKSNKFGSTMSLQKIFIDGPKEFLRSSKEKLYKLSKETLCEFNEPFDDDPNSTEQKPSRNDMQNYLLSHVLFDGKDVMKKEKVNKKEDDDIEKYLDKEYKAKIDQYCSLLEEEKPQKKKKKKKTKEKKVEERMPSMKMVEIKSIQQQLQQQKDKPTEKTQLRINDTIFGKNESNVNKFREMFDTENK